MKTYDIDIMRLMAIVNGYSKNMPQETNHYLLSKNVAFRIVEPSDAIHNKKRVKGTFPEQEVDE